MKQHTPINGSKKDMTYQNLVNAANQALRGKVIVINFIWQKEEWSHTSQLTFYLKKLEKKNKFNSNEADKRKWRIITKINGRKIKREKQHNQKSVNWKDQENWQTFSQTDQVKKKKEKKSGIKQEYQYQPYRNWKHYKGILLPTIGQEVRELKWTSSYKDTKQWNWLKKE